MQSNISPEALAAYRARYGPDVADDDLFHYVYCLLHSPDYRERYAVDLAKTVPRIPEVEHAADFRAFASAGKRLMDLHIGYEEVEPWPLVEHWSPAAPSGIERWRVEKMRWAGKRRQPYKGGIVVNEWLTLRGIPHLAHAYYIGPRTGLEWVIDQWRVRRHKESGIVNDVNDWGLEHGQPDYIPQLVKRVTRVSVETMEIVRSLPALVEAEVPPARRVEAEPRRGLHPSEYQFERTTCIFCGSPDVTWWRPDRCHAHDGSFRKE